MSRVSKSTEAESRSAVAGGWGWGGEMVIGCLMGTGLPSGVMRMFWVAGQRVEMAT